MTDTNNKDNNDNNNDSKKFLKDLMDEVKSMCESEQTYKNQWQTLHCDHQKLLHDYRILKRENEYLKRNSERVIKILQDDMGGLPFNLLDQQNDNNDIESMF